MQQLRYLQSHISSNDMQGESVKEGLDDFDRVGKDADTGPESESLGIGTAPTAGRECLHPPYSAPRGIDGTCAAAAFHPFEAPAIVSRYRSRLANEGELLSLLPCSTLLPFSFLLSLPRAACAFSPLLCSLLPFPAPRACSPCLIAILNHHHSLPGLEGDSYADDVEGFGIGDVDIATAPLIAPGHGTEGGEGLSQRTNRRHHRHRHGGNGEELADPPFFHINTGRPGGIGLPSFDNWTIYLHDTTPLLLHQVGVSPPLVLLLLTLAHLLLPLLHQVLASAVPPCPPPPLVPPPGSPTPLPLPPCPCSLLSPPLAHSSPSTLPLPPPPLSQRGTSFLLHSGSRPCVLPLPSHSLPLCFPCIFS